MGGGQKALLPLDGRPLLSYVLDRLAPQVGAIAINANRDPDAYASFGLPVLGDTIADFPGPLAGVLAGMRWAADTGVSHILTVAGDTPFFPGDLVARLKAAGDGVVLAGTKDAERGVLRQPTFGLWPVALADDLEQSLQDGVRKIVAWTDRHNGATAAFDPVPFDPFFNVNTPDDMKTASEIVAEFGL